MSGPELIRLTFDEVQASPGFADWLASEQISIALTKGNSLGFVGVDNDGSVSYLERQFGTCMGLKAVGSQGMLLATRYQIWRLENALPDGEMTVDGHDRLFLPQAAWTTGALLVRDLTVTAEGGVIFVNGLFSCLSAPSSRLNFEPVWLPRFVSGLAAEDRCHLSGVALAPDGTGFATSASRSDCARGWREHQRDGGVVMAVPTGRLIAEGLSMPCSPALRDGCLWLCLGGDGELAVIDLADGSLTRVAPVPGFTRGLALHGGQAVVGVSHPSRGETFDGLALAQRLSGADSRGMCGIFVIELGTGKVEHSLQLAGGSGEIQALAVLPGARSPTAVAFNGDEVQQLVTVPTAIAHRPDPGR
jgi:uncharacterized protein (TIGR03032 family)